MDDTLGQRLKKLREAQNRSQSDVAKMVGVTAQSICLYESDSRLPSYEVLISLARIYKVSTDYLLGLKNDQSIRSEGLDDDLRRIFSELLDYIHRRGN